MRLLTFAALITLGGCSFDPPGLCTSSSHCPLGTYCGQGGICVGGCDADDRCAPWQECSVANHACGLRIGMCQASTDCAPGQGCALSSHRCTTNGAPCTSSDQCALSEACNFQGTCELASQTCTSQEQCADYEVCQGGGCILQAERCRTHDDCGSSVANYCDADHTCSKVGFDIAIFGTLYEGSGWFAVAPVMVPTRVAVGFPFLTWVGTLAPDGSIVYTSAEEPGAPDLIRRFVPDRLKFADDQWHYPENPTANDQLLTAKGCDSAYITSLVIQQETGAIGYECDSERTLTLEGELLNPAGRVLAWNKNGLRLGYCRVYPWKCVIGTDNTPTPLAVTDKAVISDARASGSGFRVVATLSGSDSEWALYEVDAAGAFERIGGYPTLGMFDHPTLAGDSSIVWRSGTGSDDEVRRATLNGTTIETVYSEANEPPGSNASRERSFNPWVLMHSHGLMRPP